MAEHCSEYIDHETCVAYYRDALPSRRVSRVRSYLEAHPNEARLATADAAHESAIAHSLGGVLQEPLPQRLQVAPRSSVHLWLCRMAVMTAIVLSAAGGWWFGGAPVQDSRGSAFVDRVVSAARQPMERAETQVAAHDATRVQPPDLSMRGYRLVQRHRLAKTEPALIEFVYRNPDGQQLRIYAETGPPHRMSPTITSRDGVSLAQWREGGTRYALVGDLPETSLQALAQNARTDPATGENRLVGAGQWPNAHLEESADTGGGMKLFHAAPTIRGRHPGSLWVEPGHGRATSP